MEEIKITEPTKMPEEAKPEKVEAESPAQEAEAGPVDDGGEK